MDDPDVGGIRRAVDPVVKRERATGLLEVDGVDLSRRVKCSPSPVAVVESYWLGEPKKSVCVRWPAEAEG